MFNGRKAYDLTGEVRCPKCGFLVFQEPQLNTYKKSRIRKDLAPNPNMNIGEWARKVREKNYKKKYLEDEKKKEERG